MSLQAKLRHGLLAQGRPRLAGTFPTVLSLAFLQDRRTSASVSAAEAAAFAAPATAMARTDALQGRVGLERDALQGRATAHVGCGIVKAWGGGGAWLWP